MTTPTTIATLDGEPPSAEAVARAVDVLARGEILALPTETVYGLAVRGDDPAALERLRRLKDSPPERPFTWHVGTADAVTAPGSRFDELRPLVERLTARYWPGPLTLVLRGVAPGLAAAAAEGWTGVRLPAHDAARAVLSAAPFPVVATSANLAGGAPAASAAEVLAAFPRGIELVLDGGRARLSEASTVLRLGRGHFEVLREGLIEAGDLRRTAGLTILFVCTGNTCRSPMAETLARAILAERLGLARTAGPAELAAFGFHLESAGVHAGRGAPASPEAVQVMARAGLDLSEHASTPATLERVRAADRVYCMTQSHLRALLAGLPPGAGHHVERIDPDGDDVPDPIGGTVADYTACAEHLRAALERRAVDWA